jgi:cytochrome c oxidase subunit 2
MFDINLLRPEAASEFANQVDTLYAVLWLLTIFFTVLVLTLITVFAIRYRRGSLADRSRPVDHDLRIELVWSVIPLVLGLGIFAWAAKLYANVYGEAPKNSKEVYVIGKQWMWHLQHMNGIRENNELHVPIGTPIKLTMISQDVIHSFFLPSMRVKRDVLPGRYTTVWFEPNRIGKYRLECTEYCGTQHSLMGGWIYVMSKADFAKWYATGGQTGAARARATRPVRAEWSWAGRNSPRSRAARTATPRPARWRALPRGSGCTTARKNWPTAGRSSPTTPICVKAS